MLRERGRSHWKKWKEGRLQEKGERTKGEMEGGCASWVGTYLL